MKHPRGAEQTRDPSQRVFLQTVVVGGAGPAGCELAGSLIELMQRAAGRDFKQLRPEDCQVVLVDPVDRVLPTVAPVLSEAAAAYLRAAGVDLRLGKLLAGHTGCPVDRSGRLVVEPDFSIPGHPEIRAVGDHCSYTQTPDGRPLPGMAGPAVQAGGGWPATSWRAYGARRSSPSAGWISAAWQ
jgi:NADH dehydrogenase